MPHNGPHDDRDVVLFLISSLKKFARTELHPTGWNNRRVDSRLRGNDGEGGAAFTPAVTPRASGGPTLDIPFRAFPIHRPGLINKTQHRDPCERVRVLTPPDVK